MKSKAKFLVLPNGSIIRTDSIVCVVAVNSCDIPGYGETPPKVVIHWAYGSASGEICQDVIGYADQNILISKIREQIIPKN
jgi:hypothetical protein